jgi:hypothetical protein
MAAVRRSLKLYLRACACAGSLERLDQLASYLVTDKQWKLSMSDLARLATGLLVATALKKYQTSQQVAASQATGHQQQPMGGEAAPVASETESAEESGVSPEAYTALEALWTPYISALCEPASSAGASTGLRGLCAAVAAARAFCPQIQLGAQPQQGAGGGAVLEEGTLHQLGQLYLQVRCCRTAGAVRGS